MGNTEGRHLFHEKLTVPTGICKFYNNEGGKKRNKPEN